MSILLVFSYLFQWLPVLIPKIFFKKLDSFIPSYISQGYAKSIYKTQKPMGEWLGLVWRFTIGPLVYTVRPTGHITT